MPGKAQIIFNASVDKSIQAMSRQIDKLEEQNNKLREANQESRKATEGLEGMDGALSSIGGRVAGLLSVGSAVAGITSAVREFQVLRESGIEGTLSEEGSLKRLIQISGGDEKRFQELRAIGADLSDTFGIERAEALQLTFEGASLGMSDEEIRRSGRFKRFAENVRPLFTGAAGISAAFGEGAVGGTVDTAVNAMLAAAEKSKVGVEDIAANVLAPAQSVKALGGTGEELLAALSVGAVALKSPEEASTAIGRLADVVRGDERFAGKGLGSAIDLLASMSPDEVTDVLGENVRARRGFGVLTENREAFRDTLAEIKAAIRETGTAGSRISMAVRLAETAEPVQSIEGFNIAEQRLRGTTQEYFSDELANAIIEKAVTTALIQAGAGPIRTKFVGTSLGFANFMDTLGGDTDPTTRLETALTQFGGNLDVLLEVLKSQGLRFDHVFDPSGRVEVQNLRMGLPSKVPSVEMEKATQ